MRPYNLSCLFFDRINFLPLSKRLSNVLASCLPSLESRRLGGPAESSIGSRLPHQRGWLDRDQTERNIFCLQSGWHYIIVIIYVNVRICADCVGLLFYSMNLCKVCRPMLYRVRIRADCVSLFII